MGETTNYPLLYIHNDIVAGAGFLAKIVISGSALMEYDEETQYAWIDGVRPGGFGAGGATQKEAASAFREAYRAILFDIAAESKDFEVFKDGVLAFFKNFNANANTEWEAARQRVRSGEIGSKWLEKKTVEEDSFFVEVSTFTIDASDSDHRRPDPAENVLHHPAVLAA